MGLENGGVAADASDSSMYTWRFTIGGSEKVVKAFCQGGGDGTGGGFLRKEKERRRDTKVKVIDHPNRSAASSSHDRHPQRRRERRSEVGSEKH
jgi:hypothetical protein